MGTKQYDSATDLITFSRASGGTALSKISYGNDLVTNGTFDSDLSGWNTDTDWVYSNGKASLPANSQPNRSLSSTTSYVEVGKTYRVRFDASTSVGTPVNTSMKLRIWGNDNGTGAFIYNGAYIYTGSHELLISPTANGYVTFDNVISNSFDKFIDNVSVKEVLFGQADGTLQLYNYPNNVPRIEYDATGAVKGLLIEEARTNLLPNSSVLGYSKLNSATSTSTVVSPSGLQDAVLVQPTVASGITWVYDLTIYNTGVVTTISTFAKASGKSFVTMSNSNGNFVYASFNLTTGAVGTVASGYTANIEDFGNGWYRCSVTTPTGFNDRSVYAVSDTDGGIAAAANGNDGILLYGAQLETGAFPTSYIPTTGAAATRASDLAEIPTSAFGYNNGVGSIAVEFKSNKPSSSLGYGAFVLSDGSPTNRIIHYANSQYHRGYVRNTSGTQADITAGSRGAPSELVKFAIAFAENNFAASLNGATAVTDTSVTIPSGLSKLALGYYYPTNPQSNMLNGHIKSIQYYPRQLTDTQLQELTT